LNFSGLTALQTLYCYNCTSATSLDFTGLTALQTLDCNSCIELTTSSVSGCTALSYVDFNGCALSLDTVNGLLSELVANGVSNGFLDISEGTSASPTDTADEATLIANGWSVTTN
jgi:Leucine-rich repeat (LRR) protein